MSEQVLQFGCEGDQLIGILHQPDVNAKKIGVLIVVGGPQYRVGSHRQFTLMARLFAKAGYPVLRFDYRGMGDSAGTARSFDQVDADIRAAIDAMMLAVPELSGVVLWGLCDAASACLIYGNQQDARVSGLVLANPWVRTDAGEAGAFLKHYYLQRLMQRSFWAKVFGGGFSVGRSIGELFGVVSRARQKAELADQAGSFIDRMLQGASVFHSPVLLLLSSNDLTAKEFGSYCSANKRWSTWSKGALVRVNQLSGMDHTFSGKDAVNEVGDLCVEWMGRL